MLFSGGCSVFFIVFFVTYRGEYPPGYTGSYELEWTVADVGGAAMNVLPYGSPGILIGALVLWLALRELRNCRKEREESG